MQYSSGGSEWITPVTRRSRKLPCTESNSLVVWQPGPSLVSPHDSLLSGLEQRSREFRLPNNT